MAELVWKGRGDLEARLAAPGRPASLRDDELHGVAASGSWLNRLVHGRGEQVLRGLLPELSGRVALVYVDPPFDTGGDFAFRATIPGAPDDAPRLEIPAYSDARGLDAWLTSFYETAVLLRELLVAGGSLYVHLDAHAAHYAKVALDEVFGTAAFQREIVWRIGWVSGFKSRARGWIRNHDTILFYAKGGRPATFHKEYMPYPSGYVRRDGTPPRGAGYPIEDVWNASELDRMDSIQIMSFSGEKVGYPTQKNEALVSRIVRASSNPGDLVLDCFVGSGTSAVVAEKLDRRWVACDASPVALHATRTRLLALAEPWPFVVQSLANDPREGDASARRLSARAVVAGRTCTIELASFVIPRGALPAGARRSVRHWSQWIEGWCVDWDHRGGALRAMSRAWRSRRPGKERLDLSVGHAYAEAGHYVALVKAFDLLGGSTTLELPVEVRS